MDWLIWVIVIVLIVAIVWRFMKRTPAGGQAPAAPSSPSTHVMEAETAGLTRSTPPVATVPEPEPDEPAAAAMLDTAPAAPPAVRAAEEPVDQPAEASGVDVDDWEAPAPAAAEVARPGEESAVAAPAAEAGAETGVLGEEASVEESGRAEEPLEEGVTADDVTAADTAAPEAATPETAAPEAAATEAAAPEDMPADDGASAAAAEAADKAEWEASWTDAEGAPLAAPTAVVEEPETAPAVAETEPGTPVAAPENNQTHHSEYTDPHAPTLPGAESAAAEELESTGTADGGAGSAEGDTPGGHLAAEHPYGTGSAAAAADGSGPEGYMVKGDASSMTYHDEDSPDYADVTAGVWFESAAHAEAAGFRPPRRSRH